MVQFDGPFGKVGPAYMFRGARNPPAETTKRFDGKTVLVTGCNSGVGYEATLKIAARNPQKLILGTRTIAKGEATKAKILSQVPTLAASSIEVFEIEYSQFQSVSAFAASVAKCTSTLDCVLLSAGVAMPAWATTGEEKGVKGGEWETAIKVNVLSAALLAVELMPLLKRTPGSILQFVSSMGHLRVSSEHVAPVIKALSHEREHGHERVSVLEFFNGRERWDVERGYCEAKLLLMFVVQGLVESLGGSQGKLPTTTTTTSKPGDAVPIILSSCPNQTRTNLGRNFSFAMNASLAAFNFVFARSAEQGSRTLVSGLTLGEEANGRMWMNDKFDDLSPSITADEWEVLQKRTWEEAVDILKAYKPELVI